MRMFDSPATHIVITCLSSLILVVNLFLIYVIWKHSPKSMGTFKLYMLKMAITDLVFASSIAFLFLPNLVFPLPGAIAAGLLGYFGRTGALIAELQDYAKRHGLEEYMKNIHPDTPIIAYDWERPIVIFSMTVIGLFLLATGGFNVWSNYKVHKKINESKSSMSKETYKMQKSLTFILLAQAVIPGVSIAIPVVIYEFTIFLSLTDAMQSPILEWFAVLIIGAYPFVNSSFCLYSMKPYRRFTKLVGKKMLFCVKWNEEAVILVEPTDFEFGFIFSVAVRKMRMFDSPTAQSVIAVLSCIIVTVNIFLIYVIWKHSPKTMGTFKLYMLKMSLTDLLFTFCIAFLFLPNLVYPIPGAIVAGFLKYFGRTGALIAFVLTETTGGMMMLSVNDCCLYRIFVFYKMDRWIELFSAKMAFFRFAFDFIVLSSGVGVANFIFQASYKELQDYAKRNGLEEYMKNIYPDTPLVAYDLDKPIVLFGTGFLGFFLLATGGFNVWSNYAVHKKLSENKSSMSKETYKMQKSLTAILLAQAIIPGTSIAVPVVTYQIVLCFSLIEIMQSLVFEWIAVLIIGAYPFVNSCFCLYSMKPYRDFTKLVCKKILFCVHWKEEEVIILQPSSTTSTM